MRNKGFSLIALLLFASLILAACGGATTQAPTAAAPAAAATAGPAAEAPTAMAEPTAASAEAPTAMAEPTAAGAEAPTAEGAAAPATTTDYSKIGQEIADAFAGKYKGTTVSISHGLSNQEEITKFTAQFKDFQDKTGITVTWFPEVMSRP